MKPLSRVLLCVAAVAFTFACGPKSNPGGEGGGAGGGGVIGGGGGTGGAAGGGGGVGGGGACQTGCQPGLLCDPGSGACVQCLVHNDCSAQATQRACDPQSHTCVECASAFDCLDPQQPVCNPATHACEADVDGGPAGNGGDNCTAPTQLTFDSNGVALARGDTNSAQNDTPGGTGASPTCSSAARTTGKDVVYEYTLSSTKDVTVVVTPTGSAPTLHPVVFVRALCGSSSALDERGCVFTSNAVAAQLTLRAQPPGNYFLWIDGNSTGSGTFDVNVTAVTPPPPPANDDCSTAEPLVFDGGVATTTGTTLGATNANASGDPTPSCSTFAKTGADVVYSYTLQNPQDVTVTVRPTSDGGTAPLAPAVYVRKPNACTSTALTDEVACDVRNFHGGVVTLPMLNQQPGTYSLFVDATDSAGSTDYSGPFELTVTLAPPTPPPFNDLCVNATTLSFNGGVATASVNLAIAQNDEAGSCGGAGKDVVYAVNVATTSDLTVRVDSVDGGADPVVYVRQGSCTGDEFACADNAPVGGSETARVNSAQGIFYLFVDAHDAQTSSAVQLTATLFSPTPLMPADSCRNPGLLDLSTAQYASFGLDTSTYANDSAPSCGGSGSGNDEVFAVTVPAGKDLEVAATPTALADGGSANVVLYARDTPCFTGTELACADDSARGAEYLNVHGDGGTAFVFVDSTVSGGGPIALALATSATSAAPANDLCRLLDGGVAATVLTVPSTTSGSLAGAADNDGLYGCGGTLAAPEIYYLVDLPSTATQLVASVTAGANTPSFQPNVAIRRPSSATSTTCFGANLACAGDAGTSVTAVAAVDGGTYAIIVEGYNGIRGDFVIDVSAP